MKKFLTIAALLLAFALPLTAQEWSLGVGTGAFVFGDFVERRMRTGTPDGPNTTTSITLTAATRPGLSVDLQRSFSERWAVRIEGTFTRSPLGVEQKSTGDPIEIDAGELDVATFTLPLVFRINRGGAFRFHLHGGPALAVYRAEATDNVEGADAAFEGTRNEWGVAFGGGVGWWLSDRFAVEGNITDIITTSPFDDGELPDTPGTDIKRPHNVHTTVGLRWRF